MRISNVFALILVACGISWVQVALADDGGGVAVGDKPVVEKLLDVMLKSGQIGRSQYDELLDQSREEQTAAAAAVADAAGKTTPAASAGPTDWTFKWSNGFKLDRNDGAFKLKFGGRIQNDWAMVDLNERLDNAIGGEGHGTEFRRARIYFSGTLYDRVVFKAQYDFANTGDDKADIKDAYIGLTKLGPIDKVLVGRMKESFSLDALTSSKYITFMERALTETFAPGRNTGFAIHDDLLDKRILWQAGAFKDSNDAAFGFDDDGMWNLTGRVVGVPLYEDDGEKVVHLGFSYIHQFRGGSDYELRYRRRPESHLAPYMADTGSGSMIPTNNINLINPEIAVVWGPASFQAEYTRSFVNGDAGTSATTF